MRNTRKLNNIQPPTFMDTLALIFSFFGTILEIIGAALGIIVGVFTFILSMAGLIGIVGFIILVISILSS